MHEEMRLEIPRRLDDKAKFLWWDLDQALLVAMFVMLGVIAEMFAVGVVLGAFVGHLYSKAKAGKHPAFAIHLAYWFLPEWAVGLKSIPPSHETEFIG